MKYLQQNNNIHIWDNFTTNHYEIYSFIINNYSIEKKYSDDGSIYFNCSKDSPKCWYDTCDEIELTISNAYQKDLTTKTKNLNAIIYEQGSFKKSHTDHIVTYLDENGKNNTENYKYTTILMLNEDYKGGLLYFDELGMEIEARLNRLVSFPSNLLHSVTEITEGIRVVVSKFWRYRSGND